MAKRETGSVGTATTEPELPIAERIQSTLEAARMLSYEVESAVSRLLGGGVNAVERNEDDTASSGKLNDLADFAALINRRISDARNQLARLEEI